MIKRMFALVLLIVFTYIFTLTILNWQPSTDINGVAAAYADREVQELGAMNLVTAIVVTYRGLDTLGEVTVLFLAASGIALLLSRRKKSETVPQKHRVSSEFVQTGARLLVPMMVMFGVYIFLNGHLSPGGGFQGGAVVASAVLLLFLAFPDYKLKHKTLDVLESFAGFSYVLVGLLGVYFAGGFLDNRILPLGEYGHLLSAGAIPLIYTLVGLKVGTELAGILDNLRGSEV